MSLYNKIIDLQKLSAAWQRVRRNKPAAGVDNITWQQFDENSREELKSLQVELADHTYMPLPVRNVTLYKGEKARKIALYSMRDKVVQQSLASEIMKLYDGRLSRQSYAYRSDKSALQAVEDISAEILTGSYNALLKTDITHFFDNISWDLLKEKLYRTIREDDVLELIRLNACTAMLDETTGEIIEKSVGIHQGSSIAPVLSNVYLMDFDIALSRPEVFYVRYSDDILVLGENKEKLCPFLNEIKTRLEELRLSINESKTICCVLSDGVDFLGYHFDVSGKSIPSKAEDRLYDRLETMWLTNPTLNVEEKAAKALEIAGGWQQYYKGERTLQSIYEYIAFIFAVGGRKELIDRLEQDRVKVTNACKDIAEYLSLFWKKNGRDRLELLEYEQYYGLPMREFQRSVLNDSRVCSLLELYRKHFVLEGEDSSLELMQSYTDMQEYANAQYWMEQTEQIRSRKDRFASLSTREGYAGSLAVNIPVPNKEHLETSVKAETGQEKREADSTISTASDRQAALSITGHTPLLMLETFAGRDDIYSLEAATGNRHRRTELQERPLTESQIEEHLRGVHTIGTYIQRPNSTVRYIVWDVDISKQFILKYGSCGESFDACLQHAYHKALEIQKLLDGKGMHSYIEFSGYRGYHVWLFLSEWIPVRFANMLTDRIEEETTREDDLTVECFPNKVRLKAGRFGQVLKIPCGIHVKSGKRSCFVDDDGHPVTELDSFMETLARHPLSAIRKVLSYAMPSNRPDGLSEAEAQVNVLDGQSEQDLQNTFGELSANVWEILMRCSLMKFLCLKAKRTGYLTHFERLSILYVFGHVGEEGKEFVHDVMRLTMNYQYNVTQRFIDRLPEKPISCLKLREQYKKISAEVGCSCNFKRTKNCYPSPVLHALSLSSDVQEDITLPISRTLSEEKEKKVIDELNIHKKAQEEFIRNNQDMVFEEVEYMVVSVGTSYEPIVLDIRLLRPGRILFLYTEASQDTMAKVISYCGLGPNQYDKSIVSEIDPMDIYREIKSFYLRCGKPGKMYIDFTGGTKAMSAAAALAGAMIDVQMVYCSTDNFLVDFRKPNPGSERLMYIENPLAVFGEMEIEKAFELFDKYNFAGAKEKFSVLRESLPEPALRQQLGFVCLLAAAYEAWDALDFVPAYENMLQLQKEIERDRKLHRDYLLMDFSMHIDKQRAMLDNLRKIPPLQENRNMQAILEDPGILHALALTIYQNAKTREHQEKYDMATLLLYRLLEMISQRRLSRYGIFASRPDYRQVKYNVKKFDELREMDGEGRLGWLTNRYRNISEAVFRREPDRLLPAPIASLDGFILLAALGDPLVGNGKLSESVSMIKRIRSMVYLRNNSIFAHGLGPVNHKDYFKFRTFVFEMFRSFCSIEKIDFDESERFAAWINPMLSANYAHAIR